MSKAIVTFQLSNGKEFRCEYGFSYWGGNYWNPPEWDVGEPTYYIDNKEVDYKNLPKGLDVLADKMYECDAHNPGPFKYTEEESPKGYD